MTPDPSDTDAPALRLARIAEAIGQPICVYCLEIVADPLELAMASRVRRWYDPDGTLHRHPGPSYPRAALVVCAGCLVKLKVIPCSRCRAPVPYQVRRLMLPRSPFTPVLCPHCFADQWPTLAGPSFPRKE